MAAWDNLRPWPEAESTLVELKVRGYELGVLSNGDEEMLRAALSRFEVNFEHVLASDHAGVYKPHPAIYALPKKKLDLDATRFCMLPDPPTTWQAPSWPDYRVHGPIATASR